MPGIKQLGRGLRKPLCSIIVTTKTSLLKNNNKSGILTSHLEAERQGGYREAGEKEVWVAGTQRCPAEETSTIQNDTRSPLRLSVQKRQSCGLFCSVFLFPSFRDLRILFLPSLEVKPGVPLKVTHTHSSTTVCPGAAWKEPPKRFTIPHSPPCLRSAPSQLRINAQKLSGDQDTSRKRMFSGRLRSAGRLSLLGWAFSPSFQTRDAWRGLTLPFCPGKMVGTSTGGLYSVTGEQAH